jgi:penicillin-binding protein 1B
VVAGRDARFPGFNRAVDARRPIGSLSKPLVYLSALLQPERFNVHSLLNDEPITWKQAGTKAWNPQNYDRAVHGPVPLYRALAKSYNLATVWLGQEVGIDAVRKTFEKAGMADPPKNPSMLLGAIDLSPVDVAQLYNTLASGGYHTPLTAIREVLTKDGQPLTRFPMKTEQRLPEAAVYLLNWSLRHVLTEGTGVGALATLGDSAVVGKTGTTDDLRDAWFAGYGADKVGVIWIGRDDNQPMGYTGGSGALPIWAKVMRDLRVQSWNSEPPSEVIMAPIDPYTGGLAEGCLESVLLPFTSGYQPPPAPCSGGVPLDSSLAVPEGLEGVEGEAMSPETSQTPEANQAAPESPPPNPPKPEKSLLEQFFE